VAWKYVISSAQEIGMDGLPVGLARPLKGTPTSRVYLSPMDEYVVDKNRWNRQRCAELSMKHGYRLMLQLHKLVGVE
jgi:organic radical activating enzyme